LLSVENLCVSYGAIAAVNDVSFTVGDGEVVTILGANGAGKTTILRAVSGLPVQKSGAIIFDGVSVAGLPGHRVVERGVCLVPEGRRLFPDHTVEENLELGAFRRLRAGGRAEVQADLEEVFALFPRIRERCAQKAGLLSGGEQQMVAVARALLSRPKLLMLDEPSLGLAPGLARAIFESLFALKKRGLSLLIVEQMAWLGLGVCDRAYVLESGRFVLEGPRERMLADPAVVSVYLGGPRSEAARGA
jgi:branched-chain amino acid transport system ATP-binding protein